MSNRVLVLYGTQTGNSRAVAAELGTQASEHGFEASVMGMEGFKAIDFEANTLPLVLVCSSTGNGDAPDNAEKFLRYVKKRTTPKVFASSPFCVCALGDSNYELFCEIGKLFDTHLERLGGKRFLKRCDVDEVDGLETHIEPWQTKLWAALTQLAAGDDVIAGTPVDARDVAPPSDPPVVAPPDTNEADEEGAGCSAEEPLHAPIAAARWLTPPPSDSPTGDARLDAEARAVLHVELDVSGGCRAIQQLEPGDALAVMARNDETEVAALLSHLAADAEASLHTASSPTPPAHLSAKGLTAREAMARCVDIGSTSTWPPLPLLKLLLKHVAEAEAEAHLLSQLRLATAGSADSRSAHTELQREKPSLVQLLRRLAVAPPVLELLDVLPPLAPRWYSLSSSYLACPGRAHLCLSLTTYLTSDSTGAKELRLGVASHFIANVAAPIIGNEVEPSARPTLAVYRRPPSGNELRLPKAASTPIFLVGPGTGVAPFRAFLQHRRYQNARKQMGATTLYFGCRSCEEDYLYADELELMSATGAIKLRTAFSREGALAAAGYWRGVRLNIPYVQDLLEEDGLRLCEALFEHGGHIYVCGDGQAMAADVHAALLRVVETTLKVTGEEAQKQLAKLAAEGRYTKEVWI
uniref:Methionine synthase reductase n=1 Tax=Coccolithus braarudii TaxID=221442 RepID=A0A7S0Q5Y7_9EUKA|mmetsp:Transcript_40735/g.86815  ORF Transcript_40735/g.86815 Transcript_40735/m.86815 type:complete len:638 (+) Transcript_40735:41-1954(+)